MRILHGITQGLAVYLIFALFAISAHGYSTELYTIAPDLILESVQMEEVLIRNISILNNRPRPITINLAFSESLLSYLHVQKQQVIIPEKSEVGIPIYVYAQSATSSLNGAILLSGDVNYEIPVNISYVQKDTSIVGALMMEMQILEEAVLQGQKLNYVVNLYNLNSDNPLDITLKHSISILTDQENESEINWSNVETLHVMSSQSLLRDLFVPTEFPRGDYSLIVQADYLNYTASIKALFSIDIPFYNKKVAGVIPVWVIISVGAFLVVFYFLFLFIKHQLEKRKRFNAKVEYSQLPKDGERSIFIGVIAETNHKCYFDMDNLTVHSIVAGSTGGGKSIAAQDIVEECLLKGVAVVVFDPTAQWSGMLRKLTDKKFLGFYQKFGLNPKKDARAFPGNIKAVLDHREIIDIFKYMKSGEIMVFTTNRLEPKFYDIFVANMIRQIFRSKLDEFRGLKYLVVFDEIHRILPKFGGSGAGFIQIERGCREFRKWGIGIVLISQVLSDFVGEIKANINTQIQMKTRDEGDLNRIKMQYGEEFIQALVKAPVGSGMVQNAAYNRGRPFYVTFRPIFHSVARLTDDELEEYNRYNLVVEDLEYQFDQLEEQKQDVFDLRLELKLAKDKIKSGNFNMVKIYLDGLTPRIQKVWDKIGKKPKKLELKLVSDEELKADLQSALAAKAKAKAEEQAMADAAPKQEAEEEDIKMPPEQIKENMESVNKLLRNIDDGIVSKDWFAINDRIIEISSIPLPKAQKKEVATKIEDVKKRIETAKAAKPEAAKPAVPAQPAADPSTAGQNTAPAQPAQAASQASVLQPTK